MPDAYESCHEAGHGVVRVLNGDIVDSIVIHKPGKLPVGALPRERGIIKYHFKPMECECGGYVRCEGEDRPDAVSFGKECPRCREYVRNMVAGMVAGEEATKRLRPAEHKPYDSQYDADSIDAVFSIYAVPSDERKAIETEAHKRAAQLIEREEAAVRALQAAIESSSGRVERQEIEAVISRARTKPDCAVRAILGEMRVLTIDLSGNVKGFEHEMSRQLHSFLRRNEIAVAYPEPLMPKTPREFGAIAEMQCDFNTLLLVTHGKPDAGGPAPSHVQITEELSEVTDVFANWYEVAALAPPLEDKLLCLVVCSGMCSDMKEALVADGRFAKVVVAPISDLNYLETLLFYQSFFLAVHAASQHSIDPDVVLETVDKYNSKANGKMRVFSELLRSGSTSESLDTGVGQGLSRIVDSE